MLDTERTSLETLKRCYDIGKSVGLKYIYIGNVNGVDNNTRCPNCNNLLIKRNYRGKVVGID